jgi:pimeloyl-ACP methyl ester carboxylesterase
MMRCKTEEELMSMSNRQGRGRASRYLLAAAAPIAIGLFSASPAAASSCSQLATTFHRANTTLTAAEVIPAGTFQGRTGLPTFCRVAGYTTPTSDSHIMFEVWMPESGWNSKYVQVGCGGFCGSIPYYNMDEPLRRGYAVAGTDDGHEWNGGDAAWATGHPEKVVDFGGRALKETRDAAKDIILALKSSSARRSYFMGCSGGGREALAAAQRYPQDFDGIVAGSPANYWTNLMTQFVWNQDVVAATSSGTLSQSDLNVLSSSVLAQCAGHDGGLSTDRFLNNPQACKFNPAKLPLAADKIRAIEQLFAGPVGVSPGYRLSADEASDPDNWPAWLTGGGTPNLPYAPESLLGDNWLSEVVFPNSGWTPTTNSAAVNAYWANVRGGAAMNAIDANLRVFKEHGGKLIEYSGWGDSAVSPEVHISYYNAVTKEIGGHEATRDFYRLFMVPGMGHCAFGPGANWFGQIADRRIPLNKPEGPHWVSDPNTSDPSDDILSALDHWVENKIAPDKIIGTKYVNDDPTQGIAFQRPLCPFPQIAKYNGKGSTTSAASFACVGPDRNDHDKEDNDHDKEVSNR